MTSFRFAFTLRFVLVLLIACTPVVVAQEYTFRFLAGSDGGPGAVDATGNMARFRGLRGIARDPASGNLYVADFGSRSVRVIATSGVVSTLVGSPSGSGPEGRRSEAWLGRGEHLTIDGSGNLYVADGPTHVILRVTPRGQVTIVAGSYLVPGATDGAGTAASFDRPEGIAFDATSGNLYVADHGNHTIRRITPAGMVTTLAGLAGAPGAADGSGSVARFSSPGAVAVDAGGTLYVADSGNHTLRKITPAGAVSTLAGLPGTSGSSDGTGSAAGFNSPEGLALDAAGNVYVADRSNHRIRKVTPAGAVTTLAGSSHGHLDGTGPAARFDNPFGVTVDASGNLYVTDDSHTVRRVTAAGAVTTIAGRASRDGSAEGTSVNAQFWHPLGLTFDPAGNLYVADQYNYTIRRITPGGTVSTFAGMPGEFGHVDGTGSAARFTRPVGVSSDASGNLYVADAGSHTIRRVSSAGVVTTLAGSPHESGASDGTTLARFNQPGGMAMDTAGNIYVADYANHTIREVTPAGVVSTLAGLPGTPGAIDGTGSSARFRFPKDVAIDSSGNLYVADAVNHAIRKVTPMGVVTTFAGQLGVYGTSDGVGSAARLYVPQSIAIDSMDNVYVGETSTLRQITSGGVVTTIGGAHFDPANQDGTGAFARFVSPWGLAVNASGEIFVADSLNGTIRKGTPALDAAAAIDAATGPAFTQRQLFTSPNPGTAFHWTLIRKPFGSTATFSSGIHNPTFIPDVADQYVFRLITSAVGPVVSMTEVTLTASCQSFGIGPAAIPHPLLGWPYSRALTATPATSPTFTVAAGDLPPGLTLSATGILSGTPSKAGTYTFTVGADDVAACPATARQYTLTVGTLPAPAGLIADGSPTAVSLHWNAVSGAAGYRIFRKGPGVGAFASVGTSAGPSFSDTSTATATTYVYRVRALDSLLIESPDSNSDLATTFAFTDPTLIAGTTTIKRVHITQLRTVVNQVRALGGLPAATFTDPDLTAMRIKAVHVYELRWGLNAARSALGLEAQFFTDASLTGVIAKRLHVSDLREGLQ